MPDHPQDQTATAPADGSPMPPAMALALEASFGSQARWRHAFTVLANGPGGVVLSFVPALGRLVHHPLSDPGAAPDGRVPLLVLHDSAALADQPGSAHLTSSTADGMTRIDWAGVHARYQYAVNAASEGLAVQADDLAGALVLDVRRAAAYAQADAVLPGARWSDPAQVDQWAADLPPDRAVVVYCVHGHEVSRATALRLRAAGVQAGFLVGGIGAWTSSGRPLAAKPAGDGIAPSVNS